MKGWILKKRNIWFHVIATYFTCGIWAIIYFYCKSTSSIKKDINKEETYAEHVNNYIPTGDERLDAYYEIEKQYLPILTKHYKNVEKINMLYTVANNLSLPNSPQMQQVIDLCLEDIELAPQILDYCKKIADHYNEDLENHLINYVTFQRLAIIYEKQKEYQKAIDVCKMAIEFGFYKDSTAGQMPGRLARLIKKSNQQKKQLINK